MNPEDLNKWFTTVGTYRYHREDYEPIMGNIPLEWDSMGGEFADVVKQMNIKKLESQLGGPIESIGASEDADRIGLVL